MEEKYILIFFLLREDLVLAQLPIERLQEVMGIYDEMYNIAATSEPNMGVDKKASLTMSGLGKLSVELAVVPK